MAAPISMSTTAIMAPSLSLSSSTSNWTPLGIDSPAWLAVISVTSDHHPARRRLPAGCGVSGQRARIAGGLSGERFGRKDSVSHATAHTCALNVLCSAVRAAASRKELPTPPGDATRKIERSVSIMLVGCRHRGSALRPTLSGQRATCPGRWPWLWRPSSDSRGRGGGRGSETGGNLTSGQVCLPACSEASLCRQLGAEQ